MTDIGIKKDDPAEFAHLRKFGYAPGNYFITCHRCPPRVPGEDLKSHPTGDKRAITCRPCAVILYGEHTVRLREFDLLRYSQNICDQVGRPKERQLEILAKGTEELGEISEEVQISFGLKPGPGGADGVPGEAVDLLWVALDLLHSEGLTLHSDQVKELIMKKGQKWLEKYKELHS